MRMHSCEWRPDTCECVIEYEWDADLPQNEQTFSVKKVISKCKAHDKTATDADHYTTVVDDNKMKNKGVKAILDALGDAVKVEHIHWEVDDKREYTFGMYPHMTPFSAEDKVKIEAEFAKISDGKVKLG